MNNELTSTSLLPAVQDPGNRLLTKDEFQRLGVTGSNAQKGVIGATKAKPVRAQKLRDNGLTASEIANALKISSRTVFRYLQPVEGKK